MRPDVKDIAVSYSLEIGVLHDGRMFIAGSVLENVLGDVMHSKCVAAIAVIIRHVAEELISAHMGGEPEVMAPASDADLSFFDNATTIE